MDGDTTIEEKRVFEARTDRDDVYVAAGVGVVRVGVAADRVGEFTVVHRGTAVDAAAGDRPVVATPEDVLVGPEFAGLGFGPAVAVGVDGDAVVAAGPEGRVARRPVSARGDGGWIECGTAPDVRAIDGPFLATAGGIYRVDSGSLLDCGLPEARDVTAWGPHAATDEGLHRREGGDAPDGDRVGSGGWTRVLAGDVRTVAADGSGRAHVATPDALYAREGGAWRERDYPVDGRIAAVGYGRGAYAVTADGTFLADAGAGWRHQTLGLPDVSGLAVPAAPDRA